MKNIINKISGFLIAAIALMASSCLKNDIPYPIIECQFLSIEAENEVSKADIDTKNRIVTLKLNEQANLQNVRIKNYTITDGAKLSDNISDGLNLSSEPYGVVLSLYQDYTWYIKAQQNIERYFTISGQVGESIIDVPARRVVAYVAKSADLTNIKVLTMKLGPSQVSTTAPVLEGETVDFSAPVKVKITYHNQVEEWTIFVEPSDQDVQLSQADAWARVIWLYGNAEEGKANGFEYRQAGSENWTAVPESLVSHKGGSFVGRLSGVMPNTEYEVRAKSDDLYSAPITVVTESEQTVPNLGFDQWWLDGKVWCPWAEGDTPFWGTGNKGATTLGTSNSVPSTDTWNGKPGYSAELNTRFIGIGMVGKLAAGNLFAGEYVRTDGTNGVLDFGRAFTGRPTRMKGHMRYTCAPVSHVSQELSHMKGQPDTCAIYIALTDWQRPLEIRTNPNDQQLFDVNDEHVIAYGAIEKGETIEQWTEFEIELKYRATNRKPTHILIVGSASKYGDFFTGGNGSTLWIDDLVLEWD